jgi:hypothetical protein
MVILTTRAGFRRSTQQRLLMIRRREFIAGLGAAAWPLTAPAQQPAPIVSSEFSHSLGHERTYERAPALRRPWIAPASFSGH